MPGPGGQEAGGNGRGHGSGEGARRPGGQEAKGSGSMCYRQGDYLARKLGY